MRWKHFIGDTEKIKTATIPIVQADEISPQFGNAWTMFKSTKKRPIAGNVCLDMMVEDVADINYNQGDEDLIFKNQLPIKNLVKKQIPLFMNC